MLDINYIEKNLETVRKRLKTRGFDYQKELEAVVKLNKERKNLLQEIENLRKYKNVTAKVGSGIHENNYQALNCIHKCRGETDNCNCRETKKNEKVFQDSKQYFDAGREDIKVIKPKLFKLEADLKTINQNLEQRLKEIPNLPDNQVPIGASENDNQQISLHGKKPQFNQEVPHWEIAKKLNLVNFDLGTKLSGSRFLVYTGQGAKMIRALTDILLNYHLDHGYQEFAIPLIVNAQAMEGTGQLPKFADDAYKIDNQQYLIPTGEVPLTNFHAHEILDLKKLPLNYTTMSACFRREAGSAGRDTKGMIRLHQFYKVELVKIVLPENSDQEFINLVAEARAILDLFELPYRVMALCTGDLGFSATKTYDLEVWLPSQKKYREISSCSNCGDFQARNMKTRYRDQQGKNQFVHTLNGSGVAIDRLFAAILENYWDGEKLQLPKILQPYFNGATTL